MNLKKYKRFFAFGCSMTRYFWPTWADIISQEIPESYNYGQSGGGNLFIASQVAEASIRYKFNSDDLVIIMWSGISREDRWINGQWLTPGNIYTQGFYDDKFIRKFSDSTGYLIRDLSLITMCDNMLENLNIDYYMLNMAPFYEMQFDGKDFSFNNYQHILDFYKGTLDKIKPDILTVEYNGTWPQHPIVFKGSGQTADYHPDTRGHANYLKKVFPELQFSEKTNNFIKKYQQHITRNQYLEDLRAVWNPNLPIRL
jgi:hypothetical protein